MAHNERNAGRKPKLTPIEKADVCAMHAHGSSVLDIQKKYNISSSTVLRIIKEFTKG